MEQKKRLLVIANSSSGLYDFRGMLLKELLKEYDVTVSVPAELKTEQLKELGCHVIDTKVDRRGINPVKDLKLLLQYGKILRQEKPDQVITYTIKPNVYGGLVCKLRKIPYAANITGLGTTFQKQGLLRSFVTFLYRTALKKAKVVFFENDANRQLFVDEKIIRANSAVLLNGAGVDLSHYYSCPYPKSDEVRFLFVGRVMREKGAEELFSAMERLHREGYPCNLDILGNYEEDYADTIRCYEEQGWLRYHGYQPDVRPFIENSHCFVLPSYHEGMANTNLECAAMGRPLITSNIPGCKEAVLEGRSGLLCEPKDAESLYDAMRRFMELTVEQRETMGQEGRRHMEAVFDKKQVVAKTVKALS
jgi:galacturonosyltransferase